MREERLLERIRRWEKEPFGRGREDPRKVIDSVVAHLRRLLNTRQGSVQIAHDYGIPDLMHLLQAGPDASHGVETALRQVVEAYEPRLAGVRVTYMPAEDGLGPLRFNIQAKLRMDSKPVVLETSMGPDGHVQVSG